MALAKPFHFGIIMILYSEFSKLYFDKEYDDLNEGNPIQKEIKDGIRKIYKMNISEAEPKNIGGLN